MAKAHFTLPKIQKKSGEKSLLFSPLKIHNSSTIIADNNGTTTKWKEKVMNIKRVSKKGVAILLSLALLAGFVPNQISPIEVKAEEKVMEVEVDSPKEVSAPKTEVVPSKVKDDSPKVEAMPSKEKDDSAKKEVSVPKKEEESSKEEVSSSKEVNDSTEEGVVTPKAKEDTTTVKTAPAKEDTPKAEKKSAKTEDAKSDLKVANVEAGEKEATEKEDTLVEVKSGIELFSPAAKSGLSMLINGMESILATKGNLYTDASVATLQSAITAAKAVYANVAATEGEIETVEKQMVIAYQALVLKPIDKDVLRVMILAAENTLTTKGDLYTDETVASLQVALDEGRTVYNDADATQAEINAAAVKIGDVHRALVLKPIDKDVLRVMILAAENTLTTKGDLHTDESVAALQAAIDEGRAVYNDPDATQAEINAAAVKIADVHRALEAKIVNKDNLRMMIAGAEGKIATEGSHHTDASVAALQAIIDEAKAVYNDPNATQAEVDEAELRIVGGIFGLVRKQEVSNQAYLVIVSKEGNGTATSNGVMITEGHEVQLTAVPDEGNNFVKWEVVEGNITLSDEANPSATFTMPEENVEVKAIFAANSTGEEEKPNTETPNTNEPNTGEPKIETPEVETPEAETPEIETPDTTKPEEKVEPKEEPKATPKAATVVKNTDTKATVTATGSSTGAKTNDTATIMLWALLVALSTLATASMVVTKKRKS